MVEPPTACLRRGTGVPWVSCPDDLVSRARLKESAHSCLRCCLCDCACVVKWTCAGHGNNACEVVECACPPTHTLGRAIAL